MKRFVVLTVAACALAAGAEVEGRRSVFAHYMACFTPDLATGRKEMAIAKLYALDGWALNCGEWQGRYLEAASNLFATAKGTDFKLFFSPDGGADGIMWGNHADMGVRYHTHPNLFRYDGKPLISGWNGGVREWDKYPLLKEKLTAAGCGDYLIVPQYVCSGFAQMETYDLYADNIYHNPKFVCDGVFFFGCDNTPAEFKRRLETGRLAAAKHGKLFMAGPCPAYNSANLRDFEGMKGYCDQWRTIVETQPDLVEVVTWNDNAEDSGIYSSGWNGNAMPNDLENRPWMCRDESFLDLTAYFAAAYKSRGLYPAIEQDKLYTAYRTRPLALSRVYRAEFEGWVDTRDRYLQAHRDVADGVYASVMLTAPAELSIVQGASVVTKSLEAGLHHLSAPMVAGAVPEFVVTRGGEEVIRTVGRRQIVDRETERNSFCYDWNGIHRMWSQTAVAGRPVATLKVGSDLQAERRVTLPLPAEVRPGSYVFRVRYVNAAAEDARFTFAVKLAGGGRRHLMPLYLPPTGGVEKEMSFLWSVLDGAEAVVLSLDADTRQQKKYDFSDWGGATIVSLALVPNRVTAFDGRVKDTAVELVDIPGGSFKDGAVTVSPFKIGRYEITNRQYEEFRPAHKSLRSSASWRDDDPVQYVSWRDAAAFCNWLSKKEGLKPCYDETKEFEWIKDANGYRLPTECEWEYVASGRGENRTYPWGDEARVRTEGWAAHPVGGDPADVSRDGLFDLGGNVSEWCNDSFHFDTVLAGKDPLCTRPPACPRVAYRAIRGGSFGYYGSPRSADRDYNSPGYSGYLYIGFRVAK